MHFALYVANICYHGQKPHLPLTSYSELTLTPFSLTVFAGWSGDTCCTTWKQNHHNLWSIQFFRFWSLTCFTVYDTGTKDQCSFSLQMSTFIFIFPITKYGMLEEANAPKIAIGLPSLQTWEYAISKKPIWDEMCKNTFKPDHMRACANCGVTSIHPKPNFVPHTLKYWPRGKKVPATLAYPHLLQVCLSSFPLLALCLPHSFHLNLTKETPFQSEHDCGTRHPHQH